MPPSFSRTKETHMRNILALIGLVVVVFAGVGWYMGWYKLNYSKSTEGTLQIQTDVDTKKVGADSTEFLKNVGTVIGSHVDKAGKDVQTTPPTTAPGTTPGPVTPVQGLQPDPTLPPIPLAPTSGTPAPTPPAPLPLIPVAPDTAGKPIPLLPPKN